MNTYFKRLYLILTLLTVVIISGLFFQYNFYNQTIQHEIENSILLQINTATIQLNNQIKESVDIITSIESFMQATNSSSSLLRFLESQLEKTPSYLSLYFGMPDNTMINGSGWIPPDDFDLRIRPWYIEALKKDSLIITPIYRNASNDHWIVTYAKPIYDKNKKLIGVIGGDKSFENVLDTLSAFAIAENSEFFFFDQNNTLIMHSDFSHENIASDEAQYTGKIYNELLNHNSRGIEVVTINNRIGYLAWDTIDQTGWVIGNFTPLSEFDAVQDSFRIILSVLVILSFAILTLIALLQRRRLLTPLINLNHDIQQISIDTHIDYRLPNNTNDPFKDIRGAINHVLEQAQRYFQNLKEIQLELQKSKEKNQAIIGVLPDMIFTYNKNGVFLDYLTASTDQLLMSKDLFIGKTLHDIMPKDIADVALSTIQKTLSTGELQQFEYALMSPNGLEEFETRMTKINSDEVIAIVRNITEQQQNLKRIEILSYHDQLTGLYNRRFFEEELKRLDIERNLPISLIILDVNGLKLTNDAFGHLAGDDLLKKIAHILTSNCRGDEIIARIGGDEFVILLSQTDTCDVEFIIERIYNQMKNETIHDIPISVSAGWATKYHTEEKINDLFIKAENQMYKKKLTESQSMRNQVIQSILHTLDSKSIQEKNHSIGVSNLSCEIGKAIGLKHEDLKTLETAARVHDIGKIGLDFDLLEKEGSLTTLEYEEIKRHPEIGYQLLKLVDSYSSLAEIILHHHEWWNGGGYPHNLREDEIPLFSRIIAIADAYEAMTSNRTFRSKMTPKEAIDEIIRNSGQQFDPNLASVFIEIIDELYK